MLASLALTDQFCQRMIAIKCSVSSTVGFHGVPTILSMCDVIHLSDSGNPINVLHLMTPSSVAMVDDPNCCCDPPTHVHCRSLSLNGSIDPAQNPYHSIMEQPFMDQKIKTTVVSIECSFINIIVLQHVSIVAKTD